MAQRLQTSLVSFQELSDAEVANYFADFTNSYSIRQFSRALKPVFRPGFLTQRECERLMMALLPLLLETVDPYFLKFSARFLTPDDYSEVVDERNVSHMCGYPLCAKVPTNAQGNYKIEFMSKRIPIVHAHLTKFCSREHAQSSRFFEKQLSSESAFSRRDIAYLPYGQCAYEVQMALLEELLHVASAESKSLDEVVNQFAAMSFVSGPRMHQQLQESVAEGQDEQQQQKGGNSGNGNGSSGLDGLSDAMRGFHFKVEERDPTKPSMDDLVSFEEDLEGDSTVVEGYRSIYNHGQ